MTFSNAAGNARAIKSADVERVDIHGRLLGNAFLFMPRKGGLPGLLGDAALRARVPLYGASEGGGGGVWRNCESQQERKRRDSSDVHPLCDLELRGNVRCRCRWLIVGSDA